MEEVSSNTYKSFNLNDIVIIVKKLDSLGFDNKYGVILSTEGRGLIEFTDEDDDAADFADMYVVKALTDKDKSSQSYKSFLTISGMAPFEPELEVAKLF